MMDDEGDEGPFYVVRVKGLTSAKGQQLNGLVGGVAQFDGFGEEERIPVWVDGEPEPISFRRANIQPLAPQQVDYNEDGFILDLGSGVGRETIRDAECQAIVTVNRPPGMFMGGPVFLARKIVSTGSYAPRFQSTVTVVSKALRKCFHDNTHRRGDDPIIIQLTDLNLTQAINLVVAGGEERTLRLNQVDWGTGWKKLVKALKKESKNDKFILMAKYTPHRVLPDRLTVQRTGKDRFQSVQTGAFHLYPCHCAEHYDALEVRFAHPKGMFNEKWLDFGPTEATAYVRNAVAVGATDRLFPPTLAQVDPQAFWSAILHYHRFMAALNECCDTNTKITEEWEALLGGINKRLSIMRQIENETDSTLLENDEGKWAIANDKEHAFISLRNAQVAFPFLLENADNSMGHQIAVLDEYRGTQIERDVYALTSTVNISNNWKDTGRVLTLLKMGLPSNSLEHCNGCGKESGLSLCSRCQCISYCSRACQRDCFKSHKKICTKIAGDPDLKAKLYKPRSTLPRKRSMFSEVTGIGTTSIFWSANQSIPNFINYGIGHTQDGFVKLEFQNLDDLNPLMRLLLTCGPLPSLETAKASLDDALRMVGGEPSQLRMPGTGFTPLEWAAKKGNKATVEWLCNDSRTSALVHIGSPVGWAAYTEQVEIMRLLVTCGADPAATDVGLWSHQPPLLVAACNGKGDAMKYLVEECGQNIRLIDPRGLGVLETIEAIPTWREQDNHKRAHKWAEKQLLVVNRTE